MRTRLALAGLLLALAGCQSISPEAKVRAALIDAGLKPRMAGCMAERMVDKLSLAQLQRLKSLGGLRNKDVGGMTIDELIFRTRALQDPEIFKVVSKAGIGCAIAV